MSDNKKEFKDIFKDVLELGKQLFANNVNEFKLNDGTTIVRLDTETFAKGSKITCVTEKGEVPLVDGKYAVVLNEGEQPSQFTVQSGYITDFAPAMPPAPQAPAPAKDAKSAPAANPDAAGDSSDINKLMDMCNQLSARMDALEAAINADTTADQNEMDSAQVLGEITKMKSNVDAVTKENEGLKTMIKTLLSAVEKLAETPEPKKVPHKMSTAKSDLPPSPTDIEARIARIKKLNNQ